MHNYPSSLGTGAGPERGILPSLRSGPFRRFSFANDKERKMILQGWQDKSRAKRDLSVIRGEVISSVWREIIIASGSS